MQQHLHHALLVCPLTAKEAFMRLRQHTGCIWLDSVRSNPHGDGRFSLVAASPLSRLRLSGGRLERISYRSRISGESHPALTETLEGIAPLTALEEWLASFGKPCTDDGQPQQSAVSAPNTSAASGTVTTPNVFATSDTAPAPSGAASTQNAAHATGETHLQAAHTVQQPCASADCDADLLAFFNGGAVGYFSYEFGRQWERHTPLPPVADGFPQMDWALYDAGVVCDHQRGTAHIVACSALNEADARRKAEALLGLLLGASAQQNRAVQTASEPPPRIDAAAGIAHPPADNASDSEARRTAYMRAVEQTRAYIAQGDIYQTNIIQHFSAPLREAPADLYLRLRELNPAPYAAFIDTGNFQILSSSPELFLQTRGRKIRTRPIKGTRPRAHDPAADERLRAELLCSEKERAELLMIVDLERNDLGRICEPGSVQVESLYRVETYATVHHLVADVCGTLKAHATLADTLRATFPGGSITGAPKVRAMEIIDELEQRERGICCGAIGLISLSGSLNLNIAIRTLLCAPAQTGRVVCAGVGAGLVWDSDPQLEYEETLHKAEALLKAINTQPD